mmetsp:Transcript_68594/g.143090  ORF Transcript_68594/g.143090 Transcript_68594/m.143090 type:complete len:207 (+) Transcript_68594:1273-1893(+)
MIKRYSSLCVATGASGSSGSMPWRMAPQPCASASTSSRPRHPPPRQARQQRVRRRPARCRRPRSSRSEWRARWRQRSKQQRHSLMRPRRRTRSSGSPSRAWDAMASSGLVWGPMASASLPSSLPSSPSKDASPRRTKRARRASFCTGARRRSAPAHARPPPSSRPWLPKRGRWRSAGRCCSRRWQRISSRRATAAAGEAWTGTSSG